MLKVSQMQVYTCHKRVHASKITYISPTCIQLVLDDGSLVTVAEDFFAKHNPQVGGYLVIYADGYMSFSPAKAFEDGYVAI